jgi:ribonuclease P protein component
MKRPWTLTRRAQYVSVNQRGSIYADSLIVAKVLPNGLDVNRYGFSVAKRVGTAVCRNRLRRQLREIVRSHSIKQGWDIVLIARPKAAAADYHQLDKAVERLLSRGKLLQVDNEAIGAKPD